MRGFTPRAMARLLAYGWPGNVRQLESVVMRSALQARSQVIDLEDIDPPVGEKGQNSSSLRLDPAHDALDREFVAKALEKTGWVLSRAAVVLGITRPRLKRIMRTHGIRRPELEEDEP